MNEIDQRFYSLVNINRIFISYDSINNRRLCSLIIIIIFVENFAMLVSNLHCVAISCESCFESAVICLFAGNVTGIEKLFR